MLILFLSLEISAVEPQKEISIKNTNTSFKCQFVTVTRNSQWQALEKGTQQRESGLTAGGTGTVQPPPAGSRGSCHDGGLGPGMRYRGRVREGKEAMGWMVIQGK